MLPFNLFFSPLYEPFHFPFSLSVPAARICHQKTVDRTFFKNKKQKTKVLPRPKKQSNFWNFFLLKFLFKHFDQQASVRYMAIIIKCFVKNLNPKAHLFTSASVRNLMLFFSLNLRFCFMKLQLSTRKFLLVSRRMPF